MKKLTALLLLMAYMLVLLAGCNTADVLDRQVDDLTKDFLDNYTAPDVPSSVLDTLDLILENYVSGIRRPAFEDIQNITVDPADQGDQFSGINQDCATADAMKACILKGLEDTADKVSFYIPASVFSFELLYDVVFNQLCEEYMLETLGMQKYTARTMPVDAARLAVTVDLSYFEDKYSLEQVRQMKKDTLAKAKEIIRQLDLANKSDYERVYAVNRYLCDNCVYPASEPYSTESHSPYGALIEQSAVCEGYARAAQLIFSLTGMDSYYVTGDTSEGGHAWNLVKVGKDYYQLDVTWNDTTYQPDMYFLVTDSYMRLSRTWNTQKYPPSANKPYSQ